MKKNYLFLVGIGALLAMSSCSKEEDLTVVKKGTPATLKITVLGADANTRATTVNPLVEGDDNTITRVTIGLFKAGGATDVIKDGGTLTSNKILVTGSVTTGDDGKRDVVVVANATAGLFAGCTTKALFMEKLMTLTQNRSLLPMAGESLTSVSTPNQLSTNINTPGEASVTISRLVARVQLESLQTQFDPAGQYPNAKFKANSIFMLNAKSMSKVDGSLTSTLLDGRTYTEGVAPDPVLYPLKDNVDLTFPAANVYSTIHYFYTFPNDLALLNNATRLVIGGIFDVDGDFTTLTDQSPVYYPVIVNRILRPLTSQEITDGYNTGIKRNTIYSISVIIKNKGVVDPITIIDPAYLDVTVTVAPWALTISQPVTF
jgi:hypothetical protein